MPCAYTPTYTHTQSPRRCCTSISPLGSPAPLPSSCLPIRLFRAPHDRPVRLRVQKCIGKQQNPHTHRHPNPRPAPSHTYDSPTRWLAHTSFVCFYPATRHTPSAPTVLLQRLNSVHIKQSVLNSSVNSLFGCKNDNRFQKVFRGYIKAVPPTIH